jgi:hypothetical protein
LTRSSAAIYDARRNALRTPTRLAGATGSGAHAAERRHDRCARDPPVDHARVLGRELRHGHDARARTHRLRGWPSTVGPGFGANLDAKVRLTDDDSDVSFALIAGVGFAHVLIQDASRFAWSPNGAALLSFRLEPTLHMTFMARYVYLAIPSAAGRYGSELRAHLAGWKIDVAERISLLPEIGAYWYEGRIDGTRTSGPGFQYGVMLATSF